MPPDPSPSEDVPLELCRAISSSSPSIPSVPTLDGPPSSECCKNFSPPPAAGAPRAVCGDGVVVTGNREPGAIPSAGRRLYIIVRADLDAGLAAAQACHVARKFTRHFAAVPVEEDENLLVLAAKNEQELQALLERAGPLGPCSAFHEPDLANSLTAIALGGDLLGGRAVQRLVSQLPKALGWVSKSTFLQDEAA